MKIHSIHIEAFGCYTNYEMDLSHGTFHLIYGPNEAGKSTLLRALTSLFYEIPSNTLDTFHHPTKKLRIGGTLLHSTGSKLDIYRRKGNKNTLMTPEKDTLDETVLEPYLGGLTKEVFSSMFGLDHIRLREGGESLLQRGGNVGETLFEAAMGINNLNEVLKELDDTTANLFKARGSTPPINKLIKDYKETKQKILDRSLKDQDWISLRDEKIDQEKEIKDLMNKIRISDKERNRLTRILNSLPYIAKRNMLKERIQEMGEVILLPPDISEKRTKFAHDLYTYERDIEREKTEQDGLQKDLESSIIPEWILKQEDTINTFYKQLQSYQTNKEDIHRLQAANELLQLQANEHLKKLQYQGTLDTVEEIQLEYFVKEKMKELANQYRIFESGLEASKENYEIRQRELINLAEKKQNLGQLKDTSALKYAITQARRFGNMEEEVEKLKIQKADLEEQIHIELKGNLLWKGTLEDVEILPIPLSPTLTKFQDEHQDLRNALNVNREQIEKTSSKIASLEKQLNDIQAEASIPTDADLVVARHRRDQGWNLILNTYIHNKSHPEAEKDFAYEEPLHRAYEKSVKIADDIVDTLREEADQIAAREQLTESLIQESTTFDSLQVQKEQKKEAIKNWEKRWKQVWEPAGINPLSPHEMKIWVDDYQKIVNHVKQWRELGNRISEWESKISIHTEKLKEALLAIGIPIVSSNESFDYLLSFSDDRISEEETKKVQYQGFEKALQEILPKVDESQKKWRKAEENLLTWNNEWKQMIEESQLPNHLTAEMAIMFLNLHDQLFHTVEEIRRNNIQLSHKQKLVQQFDQGVSQLTKEMEAKDEKSTSDQMIFRLHDQLKQAIRDMDRRNDLNKRISDKKVIIKNAIRRTEEIQQEIHQLLELAKCESLDQLKEAEEKSEKYQSLHHDLQEVETLMLEQGSGLTIHQLIGEAEHEDRDLITNKIEELTEQIKQWRDQESEWNRSYGVTEKEFKELDGRSQDSLLAAEEAENILANLRFEVGKYIRYQLASSILQRAIEAFRKENQNPIIERASQIFKRLTLEKFNGIGVGFDQKDNPILLGIRMNNEEVTIDGMSDGTQDQLYLALRIAMIEKFCNENEPIPFILDDILINFDDNRVKETLRVLAELSKRTQVIYFTHHIHLIDLAKEVVNELSLDIHQLNRVPYTNEMEQISLFN